jgi:beta-lactamase class A
MPQDLCDIDPLHVDSRPRIAVMETLSTGRNSAAVGIPGSAVRSCPARIARGSARRERLRARPGPLRAAALLVAALLAAALLPAAPPLTAQEAHLGILREKLQTRLESVVDAFDGVAGVHAVDLTSGERFDVNGELVFPQASAIKVVILLELFRRAETEPQIRRQRVELTPEVRTGGSGVLQVLTDGGSALSLEDHAIYMILHSDNTSTNILIDQLGMDAINRLATSLGAPGTRVQRRMIDPESSAAGRENVSTPREAARVMERIATCELPMGAEGCRRVREILEIPKGGPVRAPVPGSVPIAFKPGGITGVQTVWALVGLPGRPYVLTVMTNYGGDGAAVVEAASDAAYRYFSRLAGATPYGTRVPLDLLRRVGGGAPGGGGDGGP